ncbi:HAD-IA family hydrolase [Pseudoalteromonas sp. NZS100]|uniref:HAD-IA family hydrolase n=1 Tax=Pseudoalteromonas sp. NZS100 TaxID=2792046 RepID=UPI0018CE45C5|nr:HAD-IA family hydrolase [Pseudoalteromonas sp. NZS100]MBH0069896.1 HAD-IA family hydrolase [Pseudoalteromonas sp. NZS100]
MANSQAPLPLIEYDAFLFDLDGTLLDTADDLGAALNAVLINNKIEPVSSDVYRPAASHGAGALLEAGFKELWDTQPQSELIKQLVGEYAANIANHTHCFSGVESLLIALDQKKIKWGIMTNKPGFLTDPLVAAIPALKNASVVISGDTLAEAKPSPLPLLHCAQLMGVQPKRCLYIGDAQRDIQAGKAAGMRTATALWGYIPSIDEANSWNADFNWQSPIDGFNHI